jgi:hypothetical protein
MSDNKRIGIRIAMIIDTLIDEIASLKPNDEDVFDISDVYNDVYDLYIMSNKYYKNEKTALKTS